MMIVLLNRRFDCVIVPHVRIQFVDQFPCLWCDNHFSMSERNVDNSDAGQYVVISAPHVEIAALVSFDRVAEN